ALGTSEAYRQRLFSLFRDDISVTLRTEDEYELIGEWDDYWYPSGLPESYELVGATRDGEESFMLFIDGNSGTELRIKEKELDYSLTFDTEHLVQEELQVGIYKGYLFYEDESELYNAIWITENKIVLMDFRGEISLEEVKKIIAEMKEIKK
ncbi:MAG: hypothetical protein IJB73_03530, partial [Firmicutes bacterium]|nr:hypothetical protein [Bacillota bacterium]